MDFVREREIENFWTREFLVICCYLFYKKISFGNKVKDELARRKSKVWERSWEGEGFEVGDVRIRIRGIRGFFMVWGMKE